MKIEDNRNIKKLKFTELEIGDVFIYNNRYYMKTSVTFIGMQGAVNLFSGEVIYFETNPEVEKIEVKLVVKAERGINNAN